MEPWIETWRIHNRIHLFFLDALTREQWNAPLAKGRSVSKQFLHIHGVRLMWLGVAAPDLQAGLSKPAEADIAEAKAALVASGDAVAELLQRATSPVGRIKGFRPHASAFVGYLISHESHHRGQAEIALRQAGLPLPDKVAYGLWEWGVR
jgi:uncharacterized damage-inducible protein DinB